MTINDLALIDFLFAGSIFSIGLAIILLLIRQTKMQNAIVALSRQVAYADSVLFSMKAGATPEMAHNIARAIFESGADIDYENYTEEEADAIAKRAIEINKREGTEL